MLNNKLIKFYKKAKSTINNQGISVPGQPEFVKEKMCDVQPYSKTLLYRDYGYDEEVKYRVFIDHLDTSIENDMVAEYKNVKYKIVRIIPWDDEDDYMELMIDG